MKDKKVLIITLAISILAIIGFVVFGITHFKSSKQAFDADGYVITAPEIDSEKQYDFVTGREYTQDKSGVVKFTDNADQRVRVNGNSFVKFADGAVMSFANGILVDFVDLSDNFINNYFIPKGIKISLNGEEYHADSDTANVFGEHLWKLEDNKYIIESPANKIHFSDDDERDVGDYVQVYINDDGVCQLLAPEGCWHTISEDLYIETKGGVRIYPLRQIVENDKYKISTAKITVSPDDAIVLTKAETRRQIVPELNFDAVDGADGDSGIAGTSGTSGSNGTEGAAGTAGEDGSDGNSGSDGSSGEASTVNGANGASAYQVWEAEMLEKGVDPELITEEAFYDYINGDDGLSGIEQWLVDHPTASEADYYEHLQGKTGRSAYDIWVDEEIHKGTPVASTTEADYLAALQGDAGKSAFDVWRAEDDSRKDATYEEFLEAIQGKSGKSAYDVWADEQRAAKVPEEQITPENYIASLKGANGKSAYDVWAQKQKEAGKPESEYTKEKYLESLKGKTAFEVWLETNPEGTYTEYMAQFEGGKGKDGDDGFTAGLKKWMEEHPDVTDPEEAKRQYQLSLQGEAGKSGTQAGYEEWVKTHEGKTIEDYIASLQGEDGKTAFEEWKETHPDATYEEYMEQFKGESGKDGFETGLQKWKDAHQGEYASEEEAREKYIQSLNGKDGESGYETWVKKQKEAGVTDPDKLTKEAYAADLKGQDGGPGSDGKPGLDASSASTTKKVLPMMSFYPSPTISASRIRGTITVSDPSGMLKGIDYDKYPATVTVYNVKTGEKYLCYECNTSSSGGVNTKFRGFYKDGVTNVYFDSTEINEDDVLEPYNTYRIAVNCYYKDTTSNLIYSREFISRTFTTSPSGIILSSDVAKEDSISINYAVNSNVAENIKHVDLYLLTPDEADKFSLSYVKNPEFEYEHKYEFTYKDADKSAAVKYDGKSSPEYIPDYAQIMAHLNNPAANSDMKLTWDELTRNTDYVVKGIYTYNDGTTSATLLMDQSLDVSTLKKAPTWYVGEDEKNPISMSYNRVTGAFDVYRPIVTDVDNGVVKYHYSIYRKDKLTDKFDLEHPVMENSLSASDSEPASFFLDIADENNEPYEYCVGIVIEFDDNEKTVYYDMGTSENTPSSTSGTTMPKLYLVKTTASPSDAEFNMISTQLRIDLGTVKNLLPIGPYEGKHSIQDKGATYPMDIEITSDSYSTAEDKPYYAESIHLDAKEKSDWYDAEKTQLIYHISAGEIKESQASLGSQSHYMDLNMELYYLKANTDYTITLKGYINLTGNVDNPDDYHYQTIGQVRFRTPKAATLKAAWGELDTTSGQFSVPVKIYSDDAYSDYDLNEITGGELNITLYKGNGITGETVGRTIRVSDKAELRQFVDPAGEGYEIKASSFGSITLERGTQYTINITGITDPTVYVEDVADDKRCHLYTNMFNDLPYFVVDSIGETTPDLPLNPAGGLDTVPITAKMARENFGYQERYKNLEPDTIVGYTLKANYNNYARLATQLNYMMYEYNAFYDTLCEGEDPVGYYLASSSTAAYHTNTPTVWNYSFEIDKTTTDLPKVAVFFGDAPEDWEPYDGSVMWYDCKKQKNNGCIVFFAGDVGTEEGHMVGMERGYRYTSAYTVEVEKVKGQKDLYPYSETTYPTYCESVGIGRIPFIDENGYEAQTTEQFRGVAYIINGGLLPAPKQKTLVQTYISRSYTKVVPDGVDYNKEAEGQAIIKYYYRDIDKVINDKYNDIYLVENKGGEDVLTRETDIGDTAKWNSIEIDVKAARSWEGTGTRMQVDDHLFNLDYNTGVLTRYKMPLDKLTKDFTVAIAQYDYETWFSYLVERWQEKEHPGYLEYILESHPELNYYEFKSPYDAASWDDIKNIWQKAFALEVKAKVGSKSKTLYLPINRDKDVYSSILYTEQLADIVDGKTAMEFEARLLYDSGKLGWGYAHAYDGEEASAYNPNLMYGLEYFGVEDGRVAFIKYANLSEQASGALYRVYSENKFGDPIPVIRATGGAQARGNQGFYEMTSNSPYTRRLYTFPMGLDASKGTELVDSGVDYLVPKQAAEVKLTARNGMQPGPGSVTPVIVYDETKNEVTGEAITLADFTVLHVEQGKEHTVKDPEGNDRKVYMVQSTLYHSTHDVELDVEMVKDLNLEGHADETFVHGTRNPIIFYMNEDETIYAYVMSSEGGTEKLAYRNEDGTYSDAAGNPVEGPTFDSLTEENPSYFMHFTMDFPTGGNKVLIDEKRLKNPKSEDDKRRPLAAYELQTAKDVKIEFMNLYYPELVDTEEGHTSDYFEKRLDVSLGVSRNKDLKAYFEIYKGSDEEAGTGAYMSEADWKAAVIDGSTTCDELRINFNKEPAKSELMPSNFNLRLENLIKFSLSPWKLNELDIEGLEQGEYEFRVTITEESGAVAATQVGKFDVPNNDNYGIIATMAGITQDSLEFWVSASDNTDSFMGYHHFEGSESRLPEDGYEDVGLFEVRFTRKWTETDPVSGEETVYEEWVHTPYDKNLYRFNTIKNKFILDEEHGVKLDSNCEYSMTVYAVQDYLNTGRIQFNGADIEPQGRYFPSDENYKNRGWEAFFGNVHFVTGSDPEKKDIQIEEVTRDGKKFAGFTQLIDSFFKEVKDSDGKVHDVLNPEKAGLAGVFQLYTKNTRTASSNEIIIGKDQWDGTSTTNVCLSLGESAGLVKFEDETNPTLITYQNCKKILWTIQSTTSGSKATGSFDRGTDFIYDPENPKAYKNNMFRWNPEEATYTLDMKLSTMKLTKGGEYWVSVFLYPDEGEPIKIERTTKIYLK